MATKKQSAAPSGKTARIDDPAGVGPADGSAGPDTAAGSAGVGSAESEHAADMAAAKQALERVAAAREARAEALSQVSRGGRGGSKVSGRGQQRGASKPTSVSKSGDR